MARGLASVAGRRVLFLNWRDLSHPRAGGAEVYCEQVAERFARAGADVTLFTSHFPGAPLAELRRGVRIVRRGGTFGVYARAAQHLLAARADYDAAVDFQNGIPFFAPLFGGRGLPVVCVIHHVHQDQFALHFPWPASRVGQLLEGPVSRRVYARRPLVAVSPSTRRDVRRQLRLRGPIHVIPNGLLEPHRSEERARSRTPSIAVTSRLVSHKRFDLLLAALPELLRRWPDLRVDVAGEGPERPALERQAQALGLGSAVRFHGFVDAATKDALVSRAWLTVSPSQAEGWGLTVLEANALGVPAVAFDVPGLRDSIVDGATGWLLPPDQPLGEGLHDALLLLRDERVADEYAERCRTWARRFSWDSTAERLAAVVAGEVDRARHLVRSRRVPTDLAVRADARLAPDADVLDLLRGRLRRSDQWASEGDVLRLLLHASDEAGAEQVLALLGLDRVLRLELATTSELLLGAAA